MAEFDTLYALAEIAVSMAGFAAVIVVFKRRDRGIWESTDADRFNGMLLHSMAAAFFCVFPPLLWVFAVPQDSLWRIASGVMALQVAAHTSVIYRLPTTRRVARTFLVVPLIVVGLQAMNVFGWIYAAEFRPYLAGVLWHLFQAGLLFVLLVWVQPQHDEPHGR